MMMMQRLIPWGKKQTDPNLKVNSEKFGDIASGCFLHFFLILVSSRVVWARKFRLYMLEVKVKVTEVTEVNTCEAIKLSPQCLWSGWGLT